jgi:A/G-specific adenine glycosylase
MSQITRADFRRLVWRFYKTHGRHTLPWRKTTDPYRILVSELMLQQTQVERVLPKYEAFLERFPTITQLAAAPLSEVLILWQGLGYNRRAMYLHKTAQYLVKTQTDFPKTTTALEALPGIGPYTAAAIMAFAYNSDVVLLETNVRTVYLEHFFAGRLGVTDTELSMVVAETLPLGRAREWYSALMDYGVYLKKTVGNQNRRSATYTKQSPFKGSNREIRGAIVRLLSQRSYTGPALVQALAQFAAQTIKLQLQALQKEGLVTKNKGRFELAT